MMDSESSDLLSTGSQISKKQAVKPNESGSKPQQTKQNMMKQQTEVDQPLDVIKQLVEKLNPLPLLAVIDQVDLYTRTDDGVPLFNLLMNKFLPLSDLLDNLPIKFQADADGRTPLHYATEADDVKAVQWLLSKGAKSSKDNFGYSPVMQSVKLGHRRCFLLFLHYQHADPQLPHIAAEYNRVWQLKCMTSLGLNISIKSEAGKTALQVAVKNYSYEAAQYLAYATQNYEIKNLKTLTDSQAIIRRVKLGKDKSLTLKRAVLPFIFNSIEVIIIILTIVFGKYLSDDVREFLQKLILVFLGLKLLMIAFSIIRKPNIKSADSIMKLLHEPYFPNSLDHICPLCFNRYHPEKQEHCDTCHVCVPNFHKHSYICINKNNQLFWFLSEYLLCFILYKILLQSISNYVQMYPVFNPPIYDFANNKELIIPPFHKSFIFTVYHLIFVQNNAAFGALLLYLAGLFFQQVMICLQLFGMAFMNRSYQQTVRTQDYPHLYEVFKSKSGKMKNRQKRIFFKYKLCGGIFIGIRNIIKYFF